MIGRVEKVERVGRIELSTSVAPYSVQEYGAQGAEEVEGVGGVERIRLATSVAPCSVREHGARRVGGVKVVEGVQKVKGIEGVGGVELAASVSLALCAASASALACRVGPLSVLSSSIAAPLVPVSASFPSGKEIYYLGSS